MAFPDVGSPRCCGVQRPQQLPLSLGASAGAGALLHLPDTSLLKQQPSPPAKPHLLAEAATFNLRKVNISSARH